jgi:TaqI-like C-terminal specificity domain
VPKHEAAIYIPFLADRDMEAYAVPEAYPRSFFYPYLDGEALDESDLRSKFPKTWEYLLSHREKLEGRKTVHSKRIAWWRPAWPREPQNLLRPKIITPHLVISPRFSLDTAGRLAVSHSPIVLAKNRDVEQDHLRFILAVLNSSACFWYISQHSHSYQHGYSRLEAKTLGSTRIPDPLKVDPVVLRRLVRLVDERLEASGSKAFSIQDGIDDIVSDLYALTAAERRLVGMKERV